MTQGPFQVDVLKVAPGSGQTLTLSRDPSTGSLRFVDPLVPGGINLSDLANLGTVAGTLVVGKSGSGAGYTTIQEALDSVPSSSSSLNPYVILILPGVYTENLTIEKDGVTLLGLGRVVIQPSTVGATITVRSAVSSTPRRLVLQCLTLLQGNDGQACVSLVGGSGSSVGSLGIALLDCNLIPSGVGCYTVLGDTVGSVVLKGCMSEGVPATTSLRLTQCASLWVMGGVLPSLQLDFDTADPIPSLGVVGYSFYGCSTIGDILSTMRGGSSLFLSGCSSVGSVSLNGNRGLTSKFSILGVLTLNGTSSANLTCSTYTSASGSGTLATDSLIGTTDFVAVDHVLVTFPVARPDALYFVGLDAGVVDIPWISTKDPTGFTIHFSAPVTLTVTWSILT